MRLATHLMTTFQAKTTSSVISTVSVVHNGRRVQRRLGEQRSKSSNESVTSRWEETYGEGNEVICKHIPRNPTQ